MNEPTLIIMTCQEARECVKRINSNMDNIRSLVLDLYERRGWSALGYDNWRECVTAEFEHKERYLYYQLEAAQAEKNICTIVQSHKLPESQLRPLIKLKDNPEKQREAWQRAVETAPAGKVTAAHVYKVVKDMTLDGAKPKERNAVPASQLPSEAMDFATIAISQLERIRNDDPLRKEALTRVTNWINDNYERSKKYERKN
jgi:hypothetical protein